ncbi:hypothetical protein [Bombilactobacillus mellis]|uniref:hypothetical protein n=1 Tax=Bombilactobacillus mellis TaxID=1218508 RepID=UPI0012EB63C7|nr:hypothetical protein [Bombilactobacillus mellis]
MEQIERAIPRIIERLTTNSILARFNQRLASERKNVNKLNKSTEISRLNSGSFQMQIQGFKPSVGQHLNLNTKDGNVNGN